MGTQQILMVVIGVIIVGIMIMLGISMFNLQEYSSNKKMLAAEMVTYPPFVFKYWETVEILGGAGGKTANVTKERVAGYIGFSEANFSSSGENGEFRITKAEETSVKIQALGRVKRNGKHPLIITELDIATKQVNTFVKDAADFEE